MNRLIAYLFLVSTLILAGCQAGTPTPIAKDSQTVQVTGKPVAVNGGRYEDINPEELEAMLANKDFTLINVHIPRTADIPHTDFAIPYDQIEQNLNRLPADKNAKIVLYCNSGHMSSIVAKKLVQLRYTNVWELAGGMSAWQQDGLPLERVQ